MNVQKETIIKSLYSARLESGIIINVFGEYALGSDGKTYYHVGKEDEDGDLITIGWSCDINHCMVC